MNVKGHFIENLLWCFTYKKRFYKTTVVANTNSRLLFAGGTSRQRRDLLSLYEPLLGYECTTIQVQERPGCPGISL